MLSFTFLLLGGQGNLININQNEKKVPFLCSKLQIVKLKM